MLGSESDLIKDITIQEVKYSLFDILFMGVPMWRLMRSSIVENYVSEKMKSGKRDTSKKRINIGKIIKYYIISLSQFFSLFKPEFKEKHLIFAFPRLQKFEGKYIDKLTDPVIQNSELKNNCIIFQRSFAGNHFKPRINSKNIILLDFIQYTSILLSLLFLVLVFVIVSFRVIKLYRKAKNIFPLNPIQIIIFTYKTGEFFFASISYKLILRILRPKSVFLVNREINYALIRACKILKTPVFEFQHGVTHSYTVLYSGLYNEMIDPDNFLVFGKIWKGKQFGMPVGKIINIGWAFGKTQKEANKRIIEEKDTLVVSEPQLSKQIIGATLEIASLNPGRLFTIRPHPQESISEEDKQLIDKQKNVSIDDSNYESSIAVLQYRYILGVKSSVLFEAMSQQKPVGILNFGGCVSNIPKGELYNALFILNNASDFKVFSNYALTDNIHKNLIYSEFDESNFNSIL